MKTKIQSSQKAEAFSAERQKNQAFRKGEQMFRRLFLGWTIFNVVVAFVLTFSLVQSGNAYLQLILSAVAIPIICCVCMLLSANGMRGFAVMSLIGGVFELLNGLLLMRSSGFLAATSMAKVYVITLLLTAAVQIALSLFLFVNRTLGEYFYQKKKIEDRLKGRF